MIMSLFRHIHSFTISLKWDVFSCVCWTEVSSEGGALQGELSSSSKLLRITGHHLASAFSLLKSGSLPLVPVVIRIISVQYPTLLLRPIMNLTNTAPLMTLCWSNFVAPERRVCLLVRMKQVDSVDHLSCLTFCLWMRKTSIVIGWLDLAGVGGINKKNSFLKRKKGVSDHNMIHLSQWNQTHKCWVSFTGSWGFPRQPDRLLTLSWFPFHSLFIWVVSFLRA